MFNNLCRKTLPISAVGLENFMCVSEPVTKKQETIFHVAGLETDIGAIAAKVKSVPQSGH